MGPIRMGIYKTLKNNYLFSSVSEVSASSVAVVVWAVAILVGAAAIAEVVQHWGPETVLRAGSCCSVW